jgi:hypothetical protein
MAQVGAQQIAQLRVRKIVGYTVERLFELPYSINLLNLSATKKIYSKEFKKEAVQLAKQTGKHSQVARDLCIQVS